MKTKLPLALLASLVIAAITFYATLSLGYTISDSRISNFFTAEETDSKTDFSVQAFELALIRKVGRNLGMKEVRIYSDKQLVVAAEYVRKLPGSRSVAPLNNELAFTFMRDEAYLHQQALVFASIAGALVLGLTSLGFRGSHGGQPHHA